MATEKKKRVSGAGPACSSAPAGRAPGLRSATSNSYTSTGPSAGIPSEPQCAVFFDDLWSNKQYADATGVHFVKIIPDSGISMANVEAGMQAVRDTCAC